MKSEVLFFRTTKERKEQLQEIAVEKDWTLSKTIEKIISNFIAKDN